MWLVDGDTAHSCLPKNGTHSLRLFFGQKPVVSNNGVKNISERVGWIRHPIDRLRSAYSYSRATNDQGLAIHTEYAIVKLGGKSEEMPDQLTSWERFVDFSLDEAKNPHWNCQVDMLTTAHGQFLPTVVHRFEDISKLWHLYYDEPLAHKNKIPAEEVNTNYRKVDLAKRYSADFDLWMDLRDAA